MIEQITSKIDDIEIVKKLKDNTEILEKKLEISFQELEELEKILLLAKKLYKDKIDGVSIGDVVKGFFDLNTKMLESKKAIYELEELKSYFVHKGITEQEYSSFVKNYEVNYYEKYGELSQNVLKEIKDKYIFEITSQKENIDKFNKKITQYKEIINKIKDERDIFIDNNQKLSKYYSDLLTNIQLIKKYKDKLLTYLTPANFKIESLKDSILQLSSISSAYTELLLRNKKDSAFEKELQKDSNNKISELNTLKDNKIKLKSAIDLLNSLESSKDRLEDFFKQNTESILDIFMRIHAPKEFDDLNFSDDAIKLKRKNSEKWETVNKISTGQKSALTLAIFLTMNRNAKNAPKYILFDDPVSNTDDINILAFFDFLQEIALSNKRQIFFATANSKIANLFRKKLDFLDNDFKDIQLSR